MPGTEAGAGPSAEELVRGIYEHVHVSSARDVEKSMDTPAGRSPRPALLELRRWWIAMPADDQDLVRRSMVCASFSAVLGVLRVLDNLQRVVGGPEVKLRLLGVTPQGESPIPADGSTLLSEIFARLSREDPRLAVRIRTAPHLDEVAKISDRQGAAAAVEHESFAEQLVQGVHDHVFLPAVRATEAQMEDPPSSVPDSELGERHRWWIALGVTDRAVVRRAVRSAADAAIFGFFCVLDGARKVVDVPDLELRLMRVTSAGAQRVSEEDAELLIDLHVGLTWDDHWTWGVPAG